MTGPRIAPLLGIADATFTAADLVRDQRLWAVPGDTPADGALRELTSRGYTVAPLSDVPIGRFVHRTDLVVGDVRPVHRLARDIRDAATLPETASLSEVLAELRRSPFVFVLHRHHVTGVITRADLEQPVIGLLVLGLILAIESALDLLIERAAGDDWLELLSDERAERVRELYTQRREADADLHPMRCLNLDDRLTLARRLDLAGELGFASNQQFRRWDSRIGRIRDHLAHGDTLLSAVPDPREALDAVLELRDVGQKAWDRVRADTGTLGGPATEADGGRPGRPQAAHVDE